MDVDPNKVRLLMHFGFYKTLMQMDRPPFAPAVGDGVFFSSPKATLDDDPHTHTAIRFVCVRSHQTFEEEKNK